MFKLKITVAQNKKTTHIMHVDSGVWYFLPESIKAIAVDSDGEIWGYDSGNPVKQDNLGAWADFEEDLKYAVYSLGHITKDFLVDGLFLEWEQSCFTIEELEEQLYGDVEPSFISPVVPPKLDGRQLRGKVTEIIDQSIRDGKPGARRARNALKDLGSYGFDFTSYRTVHLVQCLVESGYDLRLLADFNAMLAIDNAVHQARGE